MDSPDNKVNCEDLNILLPNFGKTDSKFHH